MPTIKQILQVRVRELSRMAGFAVIAALVLLVGFLTNRFFPGSILGILQDLGTVGLAVPLSYYFWKGLCWVKRQLLWKVRNKIIVSFAFVGIIPLTILVLVSLLVLWLILRSLSGFYLQRELDHISEMLQRTGDAVVLGYYRERSAGRSPPEVLADLSAAAVERLPVGLNSAYFLVYAPSQSRGQSEDLDFQLAARIPPDEQTSRPAAASCPSWVRDGFADLTAEEDSVDLTIVLDVRSDLRLVLKLPFDEKTIDYIGNRTSIELVVTPLSPSEDADAFQGVYQTLTQGQHFLTVSWFHFFQPVSWLSGQAAERPWTMLLAVPSWILLEHFLAGESELLLALIALLLVLFVLVEIASLIIGVAIARSITLSIHNIYSASHQIGEGAFGIQIPSRNRDQLDAMASSFNEMSANIVRLMDQVSERESLEKELEIAREVQNQLFPQKLPEVRNLEIAASCRAARRVSGDYYDFIKHDQNRLDIVVGDISGKGISAALLMASLQATIRSGLLEESQSARPSTRMASVVHSVNRRLYLRSSPESYSTLVLGYFDAESRILSYCNAGHHPPLVFSNGSVSSLMTGGTVVGLFEKWDFEGDEIQLSPHDVILIFTDGVVEATNGDGEQFGTERVIEIVRSNTFLTADDIESLVVDQVFDWSAGQEQEDDITVVCLKVGS